MVNQKNNDLNIYAATLSEKEIRVVLCTCPTHDIAINIAREMVTKKLAACVNILPQLISVYEWQNEIHEDNEILLLIKTTTSNLATLISSIETLHPYEVPEIIALPVNEGNAAYLKWIMENCSNG